MKKQGTLLLIATLLMMVLNLAPAQVLPASALSTGVVISQVYGGGGNSGAPYTHDFIELFNRGTSPVSLAGWSLQYASAAGTGNFGANSGQLTELPDVTLAPGQYYLVQEAGGTNGVALPTPDLVDPSPISMSASAGKVALVSVSTSLGCNGGSTLCSPEQLALIVDLVGYGNANFFEGSGTAPTISNSTSILRNNGGCIETDNNAADFTAGAPTPRNSASPTNVCPTDFAPTVLSTTPADGAIQVALDSNLEIVFSEPVDVAGDWFNLTCDISGGHTATVSGGPTAYTLDPVGLFASGESCTLTIYAANVTDQDTDDPPDEMVADFTASFTTYLDVCSLAFTPIYDIQGSGLSAAITGTVTTQGVVVGDFETSASLSGFYMQDLTGDGDPATSDGIFVYTGNNDFVSLGQVVRVTGYARERFNQTALNGSNGNFAVVPLANIIDCGSGSVDPVEVMMPFESPTYLERYEGMLVKFPQPLVISEYFNYDRFGEMVLGLPLEGQSRLFTPTSVVEPGQPAIDLATENSLRKITLDDVNSTQNPATLRHPNGMPFGLDNLFRGGDLVQNAIGVLGFDFSLYRIMPTGPADFTAINHRTAFPDDVGGSLKVASFNVLNYFTTIDTRAPICGPAGTMECRGADTEEEFTRQRTKILAALVAIDADIVGLIEIENDSPNPIAVDPVADLVSGLNDVLGAGTYDYVKTGSIGTDAIKVALIYKPAMVSLVGDYAILDFSVDPRFLDAYNRPVLAQTFLEKGSGGMLTVAVNHLKSKGSDCNAIGDIDLGDGQGNCNLTRKYAAEALVDWLAGYPTGVGVQDSLIIGDLNSYDKEDPIDVITGAGYTDLIFKYQGEFAYSYVFDGQNGYLDHTLASASLVDKVTGATVWQINADESDVLDYDMSFKPPSQYAIYEPNAYRSSDHDPVIVGLSLSAPSRFITGGGWMNTLDGKGEFGFSARYVPNNPYPVGGVSYLISKARLDFTSTSYDWLVVSSDTAWLQGTGMLNGMGGYTFLMTVTDDPDSFRIQIWEAGGMQVYDSHPGTPKYDPANTPINRGNITFH
jgi:uncharacterized protein